MATAPEATVAVPQEDARRKSSLPAPTRRVLPNGMTVLFVERHALPLVIVSAVCPRGATDEPAGMEGLAGVMSDMLNEGVSPSELARIGAQVQIGSSWDVTSVTITTLKRVFKPALAILTKVITASTFALRDLDSVRAGRLDAQLQRGYAPYLLAQDILTQIIYPTSRYGRPLNGTEQSLKRITPSVVEGWYRFCFRPETTTLLVVGDVDPKEVDHDLNSLLGPRKTLTGRAEARSSSKPELSQQPRRVILVHRPGATQTAIYLGHRGPDRATHDYFSLLVMNGIFGSEPSSRLFTNLRQKHGYTYGVSSMIAFRRLGGPFWMGGMVRTSATEASVVEMLSELKRIRQEVVSADELRIAKNFLKRAALRGFETPLKVTAGLRDQVTYGLSDNYSADFERSIEAVTVEDVQYVALTYLRPEQISVVMVGDASQIGDAVKRLFGNFELRGEKGKPL